MPDQISPEEDQRQRARRLSMLAQQSAAKSEPFAHTSRKLAALESIAASLEKLVALAERES